MILERTIKKVILNASETFPVVLLTGSRQVGKSTLLENIKENNRNYVTLDDVEERFIANNDPNMFLQRNKPPIIIDEIQYAPILLHYIKMYVDKNKNKNGLFWLTGSQQFSLMKGIKESLAGRVAVLNLLGLSNKEIEKKPNNSIPFIPTKEYLEQTRTTKEYNIEEIYKKIWIGSYPKLITEQKMNREIFYNSYINTYIERDVKDILNITDNIKFYNFIRSVAARTGQILNYSDLSRDIDIDNKTAKAWLSILETSGLIYLLEPYYNNINKRIIKTPKIYFLDTGLASYLTGWDSPKTLENGAMSGAILETYAFAEILKSYLNNGKKAPIYYYRDTNQKEIDFIIEQNNIIYPIEIKKTSSPLLNTTRNFSVLTTLKKEIGTGAIVCLKNKDTPITKNIFTIPVWYI